MSTAISSRSAAGSIEVLGRASSVLAPYSRRRRRRRLTGVDVLGDQRQVNLMERPGISPGAKRRANGQSDHHRHQHEPAQAPKLHPPHG